MEKSKQEKQKYIQGKKSKILKNMIARNKR